MSIRNAAAALAVLLGLTVNAPIMAQDATARPTATPLKLNQFMKPQARPAKRAGRVATAQPRTKVAVTTTGKGTAPAIATSKSVASAATKRHIAVGKTRKTVRLAKATSHSRRIAKTESAQTTGQAPQSTRPDTTVPSDRVRVMSFNEVNEIDLAADPVQVVDQDQLNELDAAADAKSASTPTQGLPRTDDGTIAITAEPGKPADSSWIQRILMAIGGVLATVAAVRFWVA